jgi:hypothetical protein
VVQYGLCHPAADYTWGRHGTVAANSPHDVSSYSGHRLLEEVAPITLPAGSVSLLAGADADAVFAFPGQLAVNRLADRSAAWILVDVDLAGAGGLAAVEYVLGLFGGNITYLPPGRLCNLTHGQRPTTLSIEQKEIVRDVIAATSAGYGSEMRARNVTTGDLLAIMLRVARSLYAHGAFIGMLD